MKQVSFKISWFLAGLFLLAFCQKAGAQLIKGKDNRLEASQHIRDLEKGTLIIRLSSKHKNIQAIEALLQKEDLSAKDRKRLAKKRDKILAKQLKSNKAIRTAFDKYYNFSKYQFLYDTAMVQLLDGQQTSGFFLNENLEIDPAISINLNEPTYMLSLGQTDAADTHNLEGFIISDDRNRELPKPFPYFVKSAYSPSSFLQALIGKSDSQFPNFKGMTIKINNKLTSYYKQVVYNEKGRELKEEIRQLKKAKKEEEEG